MGKTTLERFTEKYVIQKKDEDTECWIWIGGLASGYGRFQGKGAHRWSYEHYIGPIPEKHHLDHYFCQDKMCVHPCHVRPVLRGEHNTIEKERRLAVKTHFGCGCPFVPENIETDKHGVARCRACKTESVRFHRFKKKEGLPIGPKGRPRLAPGELNSIQKMHKAAVERRTLLINTLKRSKE